MPHDFEFHRRSIRLKGYDYSQPGMYFVTICAQEYAPVFGNIVDGEMICNAAGNMVKKWYREVENKYPCYRCDEYTIMPEHIHFIVEIVGAHLCVRPEIQTPSRPEIQPAPRPETQTPSSPEIQPTSRPEIQPATRPDHAAMLRLDENGTGNAGINGIGNDCGNGIGITETNATGIGNAGAHIGAPLPEMIKWFKTMTTNAYINGVKKYNWRPFCGKLWQRNYYEHIIRDDTELYFIREYIRNNPLRRAKCI